MNTLLTIFFVFQLVLSADPTDKCGTSCTWKFEVSEGKLTIKGTGETADYTSETQQPWASVRGNIKKVVIEDGIQSLGSFFFASSMSLKSIEIPKSVTKIKDSTFYMVSGLESITLPENLVSIGKNAFYNCANLKTVNFPSKLESIGDEAFRHCLALEKIELPKSLTEVKQNTFDHCISATKLDIGEGVKTIGERAFAFMVKLETITVPKQVTTINSAAFAYSDGLKEIKVESGNEKFAVVDGILFNKDKTILMQYPAGNSQTEYTIAKTVTTVQQWAFNICHNLKNIKVEDGNPNYVSVDGVLFNKDKTELLQYPTGNERTSYKIPSGVKIVGKDSFWKSSKLEAVTIPSSVTEIKIYAFQEMKVLKEVRFEGEKEPTCDAKSFYQLSINKVSVPKNYQTKDNTFCDLKAFKDTPNSSSVVMMFICLILFILF